MKHLSMIDLLEEDACRLDEVIMVTALIEDVVSSPGYYEYLQRYSTTPLAEVLLKNVRSNLQHISQDVEGDY